MIIGKLGLDKRFDKMSKVDLRKGVEKGISYVQSAAKLGCPSNTGELRNSIMTSIETEGEAVAGVCWSASEYGMYVEFGTGPVGQVNHEGISPDIAVSYSQKGWMIPGEAMDRTYAESKGLGVIEGKDGEVVGYLTNGQPARPYLYPALKNNEETIIDIIAEEVKKLL